MGLRLSIYKDARLGECSNGGLSSRCDVVTVVNVNGPFDPSEDAPAVLLVEGNLYGTVKIVPAVKVTGPGAATEYHGEWGPLLADGDKTVGPMMGGCYVATSDSRFAEAIAKLTGSALGFAESVAPLHDRWETPAQYRALSI